jgi:hypothetical protein
MFMNNQTHNLHRVVFNSKIKNSISVPLYRRFAGVALLLLLALAPAAWGSGRSGNDGRFQRDASAFHPTRQSDCLWLTLSNHREK